MLVVGLTGGIGCGKSSFCDVFSRLGVPIIDTDVIAHQLAHPNSYANQQVLSQFGAASLLADGSLDRAWLRQLIFTEPDKKVQLEAIFHPLILERTKEQISIFSSLHPYCILAVPLLFETPSFHKLTDLSISIDCVEQEQIKRVMLRSRLSQYQIKNIISAQMPRDQRNALANYVIMNDGALIDIDKKVSQMHNFLLEKT